MKEKEEKEKFNQFLENEKQMMIRKASILKENSREIEGRLSNFSTKSLKDKQPEDINFSNSYNNLESQELDYLRNQNSPGQQHFYDNKSSNSSVRENSQIKSFQISANQVKNYKNIVEEITSDLNSENQDNLSDCTSLLSTNSQVSDIKARNQLSNTDPKLTDAKKLYQEFVKLTLKVKFEKLHNSHKGHEIPEKVLFKECVRQSIPASEWYDFILNELQVPHKYEKYLRGGKKKASRIYSKMETIKEEMV